MKSDKGGNPRKDGSLFGDKPHGALSKTLEHRAKVRRLSGRQTGVEVHERRMREGVSIACRGRPLEGMKPRRVTAALLD
jgi:hypothetical protein